VIGTRAVYNRDALMTLRLSTPAFGAAAGAAIGLLDAAILPIALRVRGAPLVPPSFTTSLAVIWTWVTILALIGVLFSARRLHRAGTVAMLFAGPGLLLLSRASEPVRAWTQWPSPIILAIWLAIFALLAIPLQRLQFRPVRALWWWVSATVISAVLLVFAASETRTADWLAPARNSGPARGHRNVVLIFLDTARYDDSVAAMPSLQRFARGAISFDQAWAPSSWTIPSHFAVLTGVDPWRVPFDPAARRFTETPPMLAQRFRARGYSTAAILSNLTLTRRGGFGPGFDEFTISRGSGVCRSAIGDLLSRLWLHDVPPPPLCNWLPASGVTSRAERFIRRAQRPYFLTLNYLDAHDPYYVPAECRDPSFRPWQRAERLAYVDAFSWTPAVRQRAHEQYRAAMRCMDRSLAKLFAALERDPDYATTTVVVVGDHGEQFGEFDRIQHGNSVYRPVLQVPLILRTPEQRAMRVDSPVSISDVHPTLLQILEPQRLSGPLILLDPQRRRAAVSSYGIITGQRAAFSAAVGDYQLIRDRKTGESLFSRDGTKLGMASRPAEVKQARSAISREMAAQRGSGEFRALGYMQ